jgi:hypothetical protein
MSPVTSHALVAAAQLLRKATGTQYPPFLTPLRDRS